MAIWFYFFGKLKYVILKNVSWLTKNEVWIRSISQWFYMVITKRLNLNICSFLVNHETFFEMTHFDFCLSQIWFYIYITYTKSFYHIYVYICIYMYIYIYTYICIYVYLSIYLSVYHRGNCTERHKHDGSHTWCGL